MSSFDREVGLIDYQNKWSDNTVHSAWSEHCIIQRTKPYMYAMSAEISMISMIWVSWLKWKDALHEQFPLVQYYQPQSQCGTSMAGDTTSKNAAKFVGGIANMTFCTSPGLFSCPGMEASSVTWVSVRTSTASTCVELNAVKWRILVWRYSISIKKWSITILMNWSKKNVFLL